MRLFILVFFILLSVQAYSQENSKKENDQTSLILQIATGIGALGSIGSIITGVLAFKKSRQVLKFDRDENTYDQWNAFFPWSPQANNKMYGYFTFFLFNERKKFLIKKIEVEIFDPGEQRWHKCLLLDTKPNEPGFTDDDLLVRCNHAPGPFPDKYHNLGMPNERELAEESVKSCFLALEFPWFQTSNLEGRELRGFNEEYISLVSTKLKIRITSSLGKCCHFETTIWADKPESHPTRTEIGS